MSKHHLSLACQPIPLSKIGGNQTAAGEGLRAGWRDEGGTWGSPRQLCPTGPLWGGEAGPAPCQPEPGPRSHTALGAAAFGGESGEACLTGS